MLGKAPSAGDGFAGISFWILYLCAMFCLLCGAYYFRSSWQLRDFDRGLPTLTDLERYRADAAAHFAVHGENQDDAEIYYKTIILSYYIEGATVNTGVRGVKWRDIEDAMYYTGFFSWMFRSYTVRIGHRFTKTSEIFVYHLAQGHTAVEHINRMHQTILQAEQAVNPSREV
ncbi:hypothetical protein RYA95_28390 [Pseudomonas syringae pv. actinidiae]|uniref:hypothetical protein n=1 Tax=Pseudomonas syringae TaxID=317 RepID=UPI000A2566F1|nr:hypothetical protein [Pseudomonas syringae]MDU8616903.1 hypothetical protein [Pseudomonas syringae pv. actinidiae]OSN72586.1 hypothetical protein BV352_05704 [Pseudomonas syringae pv. actinidiae]